MRIRLLWIIGLSSALPALAAPSPPTPWSGSGEISYVMTAGNANTETLGAGADASFKPGVWATQCKASFVRTKVAGIERARILTTQLRETRDISPRFEGFSQLVFFENRYSGIGGRSTVEAGVGFFIISPESNETHSLRAETSVGYTFESRLRAEDKSFAMIRVGPNYRWKMTNSADFSLDTSFIEDLTDSDNWRLVGSTAVTTALVSILSLKISYSIIRMNQPAPGFKAIDSTTSAALVAKF
ncbi:DUF481 domain-containing protein [Bdellovibrionota bacterium FG-2]